MEVRPFRNSGIRIGEKMSELALTEEEFRKLIEEKDSDAWTRLVKKYLRYVMRIVLPIVNFDYHHAEDVSQLVFIELFKSLGTLDDLSKFKPFLARIAVRTALKFKKRLKRAGRPPPQWMEDSKGAIEREAREEPEEWRRLRRCIERLPPKQREVINLFYFAELSYKETAVAMKTSPNNVLQLLFKARRRLKSLMEE